MCTCGIRHQTDFIHNDYYFSLDLNCVYKFKRACFGCQHSTLAYNRSKAISSKKNVTEFIITADNICNSRVWHPTNVVAPLRQKNKKKFCFFKLVESTMMPISTLAKIVLVIAISARDFADAMPATKDLTIRILHNNDMHSR